MCVTTNVISQTFDPDLWP